MENSIIIDQIMILVILMSVGFYARKAQIFTDELSKGISSILINIALPALIISSFTLSFSRDMLENMALVFILSIIVHILLIFVSRVVFRKHHIDKKNVLIFFVVFPNAGFMGLPLINAIYGQIGVFYAAIFMVPYNILMWTYGIGMFLKDRENEAPTKEKIIAVFKNPAIIGVIIGLIILLFTIKLPVALEKSLSMLGGLTSPLAMMIVGDKIAQIKIKDIFSDKDVYYGSFMRLIIAPLITFGVLQLFSVEALLINICVAIEVIPAAIAVVILAEKYNGDTIFASKCALISHLLAIITIPLMLIILQAS